MNSPSHIVLRTVLLRGGIVLGVALLAACAGNGEGLDANGRPLVPGGTPPPPLSADFASIQQNIFTPICSVCHAGGSAPEGLRLDAADSYSLLVGVPSTEVPSLLRVKPGDPDDSYIIQKLEGHAAVGTQMPFGCPSTQPCLTTSAIAFIRQWITDGAPAAAAAAATASAPLAVTAIAPERMETVNAPPPQIMVAFNHELDASQLAVLRMHFEKLAADPAATETEQVAARITVSSANLRALLIWPARPLATGQYRLVVDAASSGQVSDIAGQVLALGSPDARGAAVITTFDVEVTR
jgi:methionine-rich copper-binding protein CopC